MAVLMMVAAVSCFADRSIKVHVVASECNASVAGIKSHDDEDGGTLYYIYLGTNQRIDDETETETITVLLIGDIKTVFDTYNSKYANATAEEIANSIEEMFINSNESFMPVDGGGYKAALLLNKVDGK